jgi:hypothetical protein
VLHHFEEKLLRLRDDMLTASGRAVAEHRHAVMEQFVMQFRREWDAEDAPLADARRARTERPGQRQRA